LSSARLRTKTCYNLITNPSAEVELFSKGKGRTMPTHRWEDALEFARSIPHVTLATSMDDQPYVRVMHWSRIEDDFTIWLATSGSSGKIRHIESNPKVCAMFTHEVGYVRVFGRAEIVNDRKIKDGFWQDQWDAYWPEGKADPDYRLLKIIAESVDYLNMSLGDITAQPVA
jgi:general stress protein 26